MPPQTKDGIERIVSKIKFMARTLRVIKKGNGFCYNSITWKKDVESGRPVLQSTRKWYLSPWMTKSEIVETAFSACLRSMQHVASEHFTYKGRRVYSPHFDVAERIMLCDKGNFDRRPDKRPKGTRARIKLCLKERKATSPRPRAGRSKSASRSSLKTGKTEAFMFTSSSL